MKTLIAVLAVFSTNCFALEFAIGSWSDHFGRISDYPYNETHNTVGMNYNGFEAGTLVNSYNKQSVYAGYKFTKQVTDYFDVGLRAGLITGYEHQGRPITPWALPTATVWLGHVGVEVSALPIVKTKTKELIGGVFVYTTKIRF